MHAPQATQCTLTEGLVILGSLSTRVFETRTATGSSCFPFLTCLHTATFTLLSIFCSLEMISLTSTRHHCPGTRNVFFRLPSASQKRACFKLPNNCMWPRVGSEKEIEASQKPIKSLRTTQKIVRE